MALARSPRGAYRCERVVFGVTRKVMGSVLRINKLEMSFAPSRPRFPDFFMVWDIGLATSLLWDTREGT